MSREKTMLGERAFSTTEVRAVLGMPVSVEQLKACGVSPFVETATGVYWRAKDVPLIAHALSRQLAKLATMLEGQDE